MGSLSSCNNEDPGETLTYIDKTQVEIISDPPYYVGDSIFIRTETIVKGPVENSTATVNIETPNGIDIEFYKAFNDTLSFIADVAGQYDITLTFWIKPESGWDKPSEKESTESINVFDPPTALLVTSPTNSSTISSFPMPIRFMIDDKYKGAYNAMIFIDDVPDSTFTNLSQTDYSYDKMCLPDGAYEIKAVLYDNTANSRLDSSSVVISVAAGITCEPDPEEDLVTVTIQSPDNDAVISGQPFEVKVKGTAVEGLSYLEATFGGSGLSEPASMNEDSITFTFENLILNIGINEIIATAYDLMGNSANDTIQISYQPPWSPAYFFPNNDYPINSIGFSNNDFGFIGLGSSYTGAPKSDVIYKYDPSGVGQMTAVSNYPGASREGTAHFTIGQYTYIGMGSANIADFNFPELGEFYRYDMANNTWNAIADFPGQSRSLAISFVLDGKGYVGSGSYYNINVSTVLKDLWMYDPDTDIWSQVADLPGEARHKAFAFIANGKAYFGGGTKPYTTDYFKDLWEFDGSNWTQRADMPLPGSEGVYSTAAITLDGKGYVVGGEGYTPLNDQKGLYNMTNEQGIWSYDPGSDSWTTRTFAPFLQYGSFYAVTKATPYVFVINDLLYAGSARTNVQTGDLWVYRPLWDPN